MMKYKIGIFGSDAGSIDAATPKAINLGKVLDTYADQIILVTGACSGLPATVVEEASKNHLEVWGFSPFINLETQKNEWPQVNIDIYSKVIYVPKNFPGLENDRACKKYRNVISTSNCDAGIIISGRWGSLNEFTNLLDMQKVVGVLTGTGGIADELPALSKKISKAGQGKIIFESDPKILIEKILEAIATPK